MPCRVVTTCPCCGQDFDGEVKLSEAVRRLEQNFQEIRDCHSQEERDSEKKLREEFQKERDKYASKFQAYDEKLTELQSVADGLKPETLKACSDDELIAELARRRK